MAWKFLERCGVSGIQFIVLIILARILSPDDNGTVALVTVYISILEVFLAGGFGLALTQKKNADDLDFSSVFYAQLVFCMVLYGISYIIAPYLASFYGNEQLTSLIRVLGIKLIIAGFYNIQSTHNVKNMKFKNLFFSNLIGIIASAFVGIGMAYSGFGVWALVGQVLSFVTVSTIVLWVKKSFSPKLIFSYQRLKGLFSFGWKILVFNLIETLYLNLRTLVIGKVYSTADLAYYNKGEQFPKLILNNVNTSIDAVLFPAISMIQDNLSKVKVMTRKSIRMSSYVIFPCMVGIFVCAEPLVIILLTEKWLSSVFYIRVFCVMYAFKPIETANLSAIKAIGRGDVFLRIQIMKKVIGVIAILATLHMGVHAIALAGVVVVPVEVFLNASPNKKLIHYTYLEQIKDIMPALMISLIMGACIWWIQYVTLHPVVVLILQVGMGMGIYIMLSVLCKVESFYYIWGIISNRVKND